MFKMTFYTLIAIFLVQLIAGRDGEEGARIMAQGPVENAAPEVVQASVASPEAISLSQSDPVPAPLVTPARLVRMPGPALRPSPEHAQKAALTEASADASLWVVTANRLNVRSGPSTGNPVVDRISRGEEVLVVSDSSAPWVRIRIEGDGIEGWVSRKLLAPAN